jgi:hypothetical protein
MCSSERIIKEGMRRKNWGTMLGRTVKHNIRRALSLLSDTPLCEVHSAAR